VIKILIVDDHNIVRQGLRRILEEVEDIKICGEAVNGADALKILRKEKCDVVLLDISMPQKGGIDTLSDIISLNSKVKVLMLSMYAEDQFAVRLMKAGAFGYLTKDAAPELLVDAVRNVVAGKKHISPNLAELLLQDCRKDQKKSLHESLSDREYQVLRMIGSGKKVSEIAQTLSLSVKTVSTYRSHILTKMNLKNNADLIHYVMNNKLKD
jgi:two-component system, NarL family, invasion response regulator UvrY